MDGGGDRRRYTNDNARLSLFDKKSLSFLAPRHFGMIKHSRAMRDNRAINRDTLNRIFIQSSAARWSSPAILVCASSMRFDVRLHVAAR
jgi:hypothetical protein